MTINLTVRADEFIVQAADRCISVAGHPVGELNKSVVFLSDRLRLAVTYTGLAADPRGWPTDLWLSGELSKPDFINSDIGVVAEALRTSSDELYASLPTDWRQVPTIFSLAGWDLRHAKPRFVGVQVENCLDDIGRLSAVRPSFSNRVLDGRKRVHSAGALTPDHRTEERLLDRMVRSGRSRDRVVSAMVEVVRRTAAHTAVVGSDPVLVTLPIIDAPSGEYHPIGDELVTFGPSLVICSATGVMVIGSPAVVYGSSEMEAEHPGIAIGDLSKGFGVRVSKSKRSG